MESRRLPYQTWPCMSYLNPMYYPYPIQYQGGFMPFSCCGYRDDDRHDSPSYYKPMPPVVPMPVQPMPVQPMPMQPIVHKSEKHFNEFKSLEKNVNVTEINNTIIQIEEKHPALMKKLMMLGFAYSECKAILYLVLLCSGKFDLE